MIPDMSLGLTALEFRRLRYWQGHTGAAVHFASEGAPPMHGPVPDDIPREDAARPERDAADRRRALAVAGKGQPGSGVDG